MEFRSSQADSNARTNARRYPEPSRQSAANENVNTTTQGGGTEAPVRTMQMQHSTENKFPKSLITIIIVVVVAIIVLLGGWFAWSKMGGDAGVKSGQYQAVFLTNGQVYFCKLSDINQSYVKCSDIYYLQVQQSVQPDDKSKDNNQQSQVSLAKLGSELHGPEDMMYISRQQVLFWENLKNDGKVVQAINSYKQQNK